MKYRSTSLLRDTGALGFVFFLTACSASALDAGTFLAGSGGGATAGSTVASSGSGDGGALVVPPLRAQAVAVGASHSCALLDGGEVACWGDGTIGQLGDGVAGPGYHRPYAAKVPGLTNVTALRAGGDTTCALLGGGSVACWGDGSYGQLGDGQAADGYFQASPVMVQGLSGGGGGDPRASGAVDLSVSPTSVCAALSDGTVRCWGGNTVEGWLGFMSADCGPYSMTESSQVALVAQPCEKAPRAVPGVSGAIVVVTGGDHTCALTAGGGVTCWGADTFGQLGDGSSGPGAQDPSPVPVSGVSDVSRLALGTSHTCAISGDPGTLYCWGDNSFGQLGIGSTALDSNQSAPTLVPSVGEVVDIAAAADATCVVLHDHTVQCWGGAAYLVAAPIAPATSTSSPTHAPAITQVLDVTTSGSHACVRREDATVVCWGLNDQGQLGNGTMGLDDDSLVPVAAP